MELVDICKECGVPPGVVNLLSGDPPSIAKQLISSDIIKKISITGSTRVGKLILNQADRILRNYCENLNQKYLDKKIDPVIGRKA